MAKHIPRLFIDAALSTGAIITPDEQQSHHLLHVLRLREAEVVHVFNGQGGEYRATAVEVGKRHIGLQIDAFLDVNRESPLNISLAQGIARGERMDFAIQKAVELGVQSIQPLHTEKSQHLPASRLEKKQAHWQAVARSAAEQAGRCHVPAVAPAAELSAWLTQSRQLLTNHLKLLLNPVATQCLSASKPPESVCILIGPESGLTDGELHEAMTQGFSGIQLGARTLRTETAGLAAIAALQMLWGDFSQPDSGQ